MNEGIVSISNGYTLKLGEDVEKSLTTGASWTVSGTTATYKASETSAGYSLSSDGKTIIYSNASGGKTLITITGLKNGLISKNGVIDGISIQNNIVKVSSRLIGNEEVKIIGEGYTLSILTDLKIPNGTSVKNNLLTVSNKFTDNTINLNEEWATNILKVDSSSVSRSLNIFGNSSNNSIKSGKGSDTITGATGNDTLTGGAGADVFVYESGNDLITDYKTNEDTIKFDFYSLTNSTVKSSDVILTTANGNLTIKGAKDKVVTFLDDSGETSEKIFFADTSYAPLATGLTYDAKRTILTALSKFSDNEIDLGNYLPTVTKVNASALAQGINIIGNDSANSIKGGKGNDSILGGSNNDKILGETGNDTLNGGTGNDTLTGGAGKDIFIYENGNDYVTDYKVSEDKIVLTNGTVNNSSLKGSDIILYTDDGTITVKSGKNKKITVTDSEGNTSTKIYGRLWYNEDRTSVLLASTFTGSLTVGDYDSNVEKIDASQVKAAIKIVGNDNDNTILGSTKVDSIYGGKGNDYINGGTGNEKIFG